MCQCDEIAATAAAALPLILSVYAYLYRGEEHFKARRPHRKKLNPGITDDIIKLLNESTVCVEEGLFSRMGLYNKITLRASAHTGGGLLYPNTTQILGPLGEGVALVRYKENCELILGVNKQLRPGPSKRPLFLNC